MSDDELRNLARALEASGSVADRLAYAHALERAGRADDALPVLLAGMQEPRVRHEIARWPAWSRAQSSRAGTRWIDAPPVERPRVAWHVSLGSVRIDPDDSDRAQLAASPLAVAAEHRDRRSELAVTVRDPATGSERFLVRNARLVGIAGECVVVRTPEGLQARDAFTGEPREAPVLAPDPGGSERRVLAADEAGSIVGSGDEPRALLGQDGRELWSVPDVRWVAALAPELVVFSRSVAGKLELVVVDRATGRTRSVIGDLPWPNVIAAARERIHVVGARARERLDLGFWNEDVKHVREELVALTLEGAVAWRLDLGASPGEARVVDLAAAAGRLYVLRGEGGLVCVEEAPEESP